MNTLIPFLIFSTILSGCATDKIVHEWSGHKTTATRTAFGTNLTFGHFTIEAARENECMPSITIDSVKSDQVEAIKAAAEGVAKGLAEGSKP